MNLDKLEKTINESFEKKEKVNPKSDNKIIKAINLTETLPSSSIEYFLIWLLKINIAFAVSEKVCITRENK